MKFLLLKQDSIINAFLFISSNQQIVKIELLLSEKAFRFRFVSVLTSKFLCNFFQGVEDKNFPSYTGSIFNILLHEVSPEQAY